MPPTFLKTIYVDVFNSSWIILLPKSVIKNSTGVTGKK